MCELGDRIPARLYVAVAKVLTYVYQLRTVRRQGGAIAAAAGHRAAEE